MKAIRKVIRKTLVENQAPNPLLSPEELQDLADRYNILNVNELDDIKIGNDRFYDGIRPFYARKLYRGLKKKGWSSASEKFDHWTTNPVVAKSYGDILLTKEKVSLSNYFAWNFSGSEYNQELHLISQLRKAVLKSRETGLPQLYQFYEYFLIPANCEALVLIDIIDNSSGEVELDDEEDERWNEEHARNLSTVVAFPRQ